MTSHSQFPSKGQSGTSGVVVVGAGLAGLFTALKLAPVPVTVVAGAHLGEGASSLWAQAGIAAALAEGDTPEAHAADTIHAGAGIVDEKIALLMAREARERIEDLLRYGVPFDKDLEGHWALGREAAPFDRSIDVQLSRLRQRLRDDAREPRIIKTVRNQGYVLAAAVERVD